MPLFSRFKNKGAQPAKNKITTDVGHTAPQQPRWQSTWNSKTVVPEEVEELVRACTAEMKSRGTLYANRLLSMLLTGAQPKHWIPLSYFFPSDHTPTPAMHALSFAITSSTTQKAQETSAGLNCSES